MRIEPLLGMLSGAALGEALGHVAQPLNLRLWRDPAVWKTAYRSDAAGVALRYFEDQNRLVQQARGCTAAFGTAVSAATGCAAVLLLSLALEGVSERWYAQRVVELADGVSPQLDGAFYRLGHALAWGDEKSALKHIARDGVESASAVAAYCVMRWPDDLVRAVSAAADQPLSPVFTAALTGALVGIRFNMDQLPERWRAQLDAAPYLKMLAARWQQGYADEHTDR